MILIVLGLTVVLIIILLILSPTSKKDQSITEQDKIKTSQGENNIVALPTQTASSPQGGGISGGKLADSSVAVASVTPFPGSGDLDWTRNDKIDREKLVENSKVRNISACELSGLENSWKNPVEKFVCDSMEFLDLRVLEGLNQLACMLSLNALQTNVDADLDMAYIDGECRIIDRK
ncbi:MAG: hypothetical protein BWY43_00519 [candidate division WS2 bacterium ADurb.Bin280]|uniref:Uncharacterized protein n=1 Tax=candidate division WS2 bacterium ADurb.Bin280 TaxID=1852829 RepID=A0A1V5SEK6_9BACT|nr:MAG: hypothetical protein BWY43_00519 [candidate division WS2 bacterium ADurb.Bin280]